VSQPRRGFPAAARTRITATGPLPKVVSAEAGSGKIFLEAIEKICLFRGVSFPEWPDEQKSATTVAITGHSSKYLQILEYTAFRLVNP
jgi:hypothetical protein